MTPSHLRRGALAALAALGILLLSPPGDAQNGTALKGTASRVPGMVDIPAGEFTMGVDQKVLDKQFRPGSNQRKWHPKLLGGDEPFLSWLLACETPEHTASTEAYAIGRYCVTNAQYETFIKDTAMSTIWIGGNRRTIAQVGVSIFGENVKDEVLIQIYWLNSARLDQQKVRVYADNAALVKAALDSFNVGRPPGNLVQNFDDLPENERVKAWIAFQLPEDTALVVYNRLIPRNWPRGAVTDELANLPVVYVTADDADDFAEWAGMHIPFEPEWEKAARGPKGWLWPWGPTWNHTKRNEKNLLLWLETDPEMSGGPAPDTKDHPIAVDALPEGQSGYGCFHMLGNVYQWTRSSPVLYPGTKAEAKGYFGKKGFRVLRGAAYTTGMPSSRNGELVIRNTARMLAFGPDEPVADGAHYAAIGFRTAKYPAPARDVIMHRLEHVRLPAADPDKGLEFDAVRAYGVELNSYVPEAQAGPGRVYVTGPSRIVGVLPLSLLPYSTAKHLVAAQADPKPTDPPVLLALLMWNADLTLDLIEFVKEKPVVVQPPEEGGAEDGGEGEGGTEEGAGEGEGEGEGAGEGDGEGEGKDEGEGEGDGGEDPAAKPEDAPPGPEEGPTPVPTPVGPPKIVERRGWVAPEPGTAYFLAIENGRFVLLRKKIAEGYETVAILPVVDEVEGARPIAERISKGSVKEIKRKATIDPVTGVVTISFAIPTGSKMSSDVFGLTIRLKVKGKLSGTWSQTTE